MLSGPFSSIVWKDPAAQSGCSPLISIERLRLLGCLIPLPNEVL